MLRPYVVSSTTAAYPFTPTRFHPLTTLLLLQAEPDRL